ncbi:SPT5_1 [Sanghuangporus sanghuang]
MKHFPPHCLVFHIPWLAGRVYLWVPDIQVINDMFAARGRTQTACPPTRVPSDEQGLVFAMLQRSQPEYHIGQWIKVKKGKFAGDFGVVEEVSRDGRTVRIAAMARVHDSPEQDNVQRPEMCLATLSWLRDTFKSEPITHYEDGSYEFRGGRYRDGLRLLRMTVASVQPAFPSLHEVQPFHLQHFGDLQDLESYVQSGDLVAIHSGSLMNLVGVVQERLDLEVIVGQLRRLDTLEEIIDNDWFSRPAGEERTYWDSLRGLRRSDVLLDLEQDSEDDKIRGVASTHVRHICRFLDVGDEVLVRVGLHSGKHGMIIEQHGNMLNLLFKDSELSVEVSRFWVETVSKAPMRIAPAREENATHIFNKGTVCICIGEYAGRWGKILQVEGRANILVLIRGANGHNDVVEEYSADQLVEWTPDMIEHGSLPLAMKDDIYTKTHRSQFVGKYVFIWNRGVSASGRRTRFAKGMHGFVTEVNEKRKTAGVAFQNREETFPLRNLVSGDFLCSLDREAPLSPPKFLYLFRRVQELQARRGTSTHAWASNLNPRHMERSDEERAKEYEPVPMQYEPVTG